MTVEQLAKHHAMTNYARAEKQSIEDASYIQDVAYYSFIEGYKAASSKEVESGFNSELKGWIALFKDEKNYLDFLKWQREQTKEVSNNPLK